MDRRSISGSVRQLHAHQGATCARGAVCSTSIARLIRTHRSCPSLSLPSGHQLTASAASETTARGQQPWRCHLIETTARPFATRPRHRTRVFRSSTLATSPACGEGPLSGSSDKRSTPGLLPFGPGHDHIGLPSAATGTDKLLAPIEYAGGGAVPSSHLCRVRLDLMLACLAPHD